MVPLHLHRDEFTLRFLRKCVETNMKWDSDYGQLVRRHRLRTTAQLNLPNFTRLRIKHNFSQLFSNWHL
jgi:hypothetical protein